MNSGVKIMSLKSAFFGQKGGKERIFHDEQDASTLVAMRLTSLLPSNLSQPIAIVCIGTDRSTGDSLGPLVGTMLKEKDVSSFLVYGTLEDPIHAMNLQEKLNMIHSLHENAFIIGIDACLGRLKSVGAITIGEGPVRPGAGVNKDLPPVGDIHITGTVNVSGFMEFFVLQNTRLHLVMNMAKTIANGIYEADLQLMRRIHLAKLDMNHEKYKFF
jgi:putative sporulation protein YyaC